MTNAEAAAVLLRPWLGEAFLAHCDVCARAGALLDAFDARRPDFESLLHALDALLFRAVRDMTEGDMRVLLDDGRLMRVRVDDIAQMADEVLYLAFSALPRGAWHCAQVRAFAMTHDSLSALRALYVDFAAFQTEDERRLIARTARACHPEYRWRAWLPETEEIK